MSSQISAFGKPAALRRYVLGLLAVSWLNMAVAPCAMAYESDDYCPHHAPVEKHDMASHHGHGEADTGPSCATAQPECCELAAASVDSRGNKPQFKSALEMVLITAPLTPVLPSRASKQPHVASDPPDITGAWPPLHVLNCVYLD